MRLSPAKPKLEIGEPIELKLEVSNTADKPVLCKPEGNRLEAIQVSPPWRREESNPGSEPAKARQWFHCNFRLDAKPILLPPGTAISLTESYPLSKYYFFAQEGTYYFQFVGQDSSIGESPLPPSNICAIELTNPLFTVVKPSAYSSKLDEPILASVLASSQSTHDVAISNSFGFDRMQVLEVLGPDGDPLDRIEQFSGDAADDPPALKSGETRSLFGEINLAKHFIFLDSGNYKLRFKGGEGGRGFRKPEQRMGPGGMSVESECMPQAGVEITDYVPIPPAADADLLIASGTPLPLSQLLGLIRDRLGERYRLRFFANGENEPPTPMIRAGKDDDGVRIEAQTRDPSRVVTKSQTVVRIWLLADSADGAAVSAAEADSKRQSVDRSDEAIQFLGKFRGRFAYVQYYPGADYVCPEIRALLPTLVAQSSN
ncbi:hypothetical protein HY256_08300 [Candidatus Sumerlaeota bacterium]|nr:hypothetical protein [Candidatus Sumerlaeota bacterium]